MHARFRRERILEGLFWLAVALVVAVLVRIGVGLPSGEDRMGALMTVLVGVVVVYGLYRVAMLLDRRR